MRKDEDRRAAQVEIDAIVALSLEVSTDELCMIYRTQFPVMRRYDQEDRFDANGRKVPKDVMKLQSKLRDGEELSVVDRTCWDAGDKGARGDVFVDDGTCAKSAVNLSGDGAPAFPAFGTLLRVVHGVFDTTQL